MNDRIFWRMEQIAALSTIQTYIDVNAEQLSEAVELL